MEWRIGVIPRPPWYVRKGSPQAFRTAHNAHMVQEENAALREASAPSPPAVEAPGGGSQTAGEQTVPAATRKAPIAERNSASSEQARVLPSLMRKLAALLDDWRACPARVCRRHRRCASSALECTSAPRTDVSPEAGDAALADLQRALARRSAAFSSTEGK